MKKIWMIIGRVMGGAPCGCSAAALEMIGGWGVVLKKFEKK